MIAFLLAGFDSLMMTTALIYDRMESLSSFSSLRSYWTTSFASIHLKQGRRLSWLISFNEKSDTASAVAKER